MLYVLSLLEMNPVFYTIKVRVELAWKTNGVDIGNTVTSLTYKKSIYISAMSYTIQFILLEFFF